MWLLCTHDKKKRDKVHICSGNKQATAAVWPTVIHHKTYLNFRAIGVWKPVFKSWKYRVKCCVTLCCSHPPFLKNPKGKRRGPEVVQALVPGPDPRTVSARSWECRVRIVTGCGHFYSPAPSWPMFFEHSRDSAWRSTFIILKLSKEFALLNPI